MSRLAGRVGLYGIATVLPSAVSFFFLPILTRQMPKSEFGTMGALTAFFNVFFILFTFYLDRSLGRLYFCYEGEARKELVGNLFLAVVALATVGILLTMVLSPFFERFYPAISARRLDWYGLSVFFNVFVYFSRTYCASAERPVPYLWISAALSGTTVLGLFWFVSIQREGVDGWLKALILANAAVAIPAVIGLARVSRFRPRWSFVREAIGYAGPMIPAFFCNWLSGSADKLFVGRLAGMNTNATYGAAWQLENILEVCSQPVFMTYAPLFYRLSAGGEDDVRLIRACNRILLSLLSLGSCLLIAVAPLLVRIVLPPSYRDATGTLAWLVVAGYYTLAAGIAVLGIYYSRRSELVLLTSAAAAFAAVAADVTLIPSLGRYGAVAGQLLSSAILMTGQFMLAKRVYGTVIGTRYLVLNLALVTVMAAAVEGQTRTVIPFPWAAIDLAVISVLCLQLLSEKATLAEVWSRDLWKPGSLESVAATG